VSDVRSVDFECSYHFDSFHRSTFMPDCQTQTCVTLKANVFTGFDALTQDPSFCYSFDKFLDLLKG